LIHGKQKRVALSLPHNSTNKYSAHMLRNEEADGGARIYLKGAPEIINLMC
jgi:magnesium-transporting ATPase (P-type)